MAIDDRKIAFLKPSNKSLNENYQTEVVGGDNFSKDLVGETGITVWGRLCLFSCLPFLPLSDPVPP